MDKVELPLLRGNEREKGIPISVVAGLVFLIVFLIVAFLSITIKNTYKLHYSEASNLDYKVYLQKNTDFAKPYYSKSDDVSFLTSLIDYIDTDFDYTFKSAENIGLEYSYYIDAITKVDGIDGKNIWSNVEHIKEETKTSDLSGTSFKISENVKLNYAKYDQLADNFIRKYKISGDAYLEVNLYVTLSGKHNDFDKKISDKAVMTLKVPLNVKTVSIDLDYDIANSTDEVLQYKSTMISNPVLFVIAIVLSVADLIAVALIVSWIIKHRDNATVYRKKLNKILRENERVISL